jgi:protein-S-isoprenylcysteine O-methyltransferase Ste14
MTARVGGVSRHHQGDDHWPQAAASVAVGLAFFALWFWLLPQWLHFHANTLPWRWIAAVPSVLGFAVALRCVWDFGWTGRGTPAPIAPPKRLVVIGFYRYVRNPMYVGFFTGWVGLWIVFGRATLRALVVAGLIVVGVALFVRLYEEPTLRGKFGPAYDEYCRNVHRWLPRLRPWNATP